jgi:hypothetical protein
MPTPLQAAGGKGHEPYHLNIAGSFKEACPQSHLERLGELSTLIPPNYRPVWLPATRHLEIEQGVSCPSRKPAPAFGGLLVRVRPHSPYRGTLCATTVSFDFLLKPLDCGS